MTEILKLFGSLVCALKKHKRGKPLGAPYMTDAGLFQRFSCPRCGRTTRYRAKEPKQGTPL